MMYMSYVIGGWVIGMTAYTILNMKTIKNKSKHRCNCRNELIKLKKFEKQFNDSTKDLMS